jgi:hypothetical protein
MPRLLRTTAARICDLGLVAQRIVRTVSDMDFRVRSGSRALAIILTSRERVRFDLAAAYLAAYLPHLFLREWINIPRWREFRCFMLDRQLCGISQYHYTDGVSYPDMRFADLFLHFFQSFATPPILMT